MLASLQLEKIIRENLLQSLIGDMIQYIPKLGILRDSADLKEGHQIVSLMDLLQATLKRQERGVLEIHHGQTAHETIMQRIIDFVALTVIFGLTQPISEYPAQAAKSQCLFNMHKEFIPHLKGNV